MSISAATPTQVPLLLGQLAHELDNLEPGDSLPVELASFLQKLNVSSAQNFRVGDIRTAIRNALTATSTVGTGTLSEPYALRISATGFESLNKHWGKHRDFFLGMLITVEGFKANTRVGDPELYCACSSSFSVAFRGHDWKPSDAAGHSEQLVFPMITAGLDLESATVDYHKITLHPFLWHVEDPNSPTLAKLRSLFQQQNDIRDIVNGLWKKSLAGHQVVHSLCEALGGALDGAASSLAALDPALSLAAPEIQAIEPIVAGFAKTLYQIIGTPREWCFEGTVPSYYMWTKPAPGSSPSTTGCLYTTRAEGDYPLTPDFTRPGVSTFPVEQNVPSLLANSEAGDIVFRDGHESVRVHMGLDLYWRGSATANTQPPSQAKQ
eukprot:ANDGO_07643.mRNA.1 hypothetical protein